MLAWVLNLGFAASPPGLVTVPNIVGETQSQATTDITALGLTVSVGTAYSSVVAAGLVISQVPAGGSQVNPGSDVAIVVSLGVQPETGVPGGPWGPVQRSMLNDSHRPPRKAHERLEELDEQIEEIEERIEALPIPQPVEPFRIPLADLSTFQRDLTALRTNLQALQSERDTLLALMMLLS